MTKNSLWRSYTDHCYTFHYIYACTLDGTFVPVEIHRNTSKIEHTYSQTISRTITCRYFSVSSIVQVSDLKELNPKSKMSLTRSLKKIRGPSLFRSDAISTACSVKSDCLQLGLKRCSLPLKEQAQFICLHLGVWYVFERFSIFKLYACIGTHAHELPWSLAPFLMA